MARGLFFLRCLPGWEVLCLEDGPELRAGGDGDPPGVWLVPAAAPEQHQVDRLAAVQQRCYEGQGPA